MYYLKNTKDFFALFFSHKLLEPENIKKSHKTISVLSQRS